jgi:hypothetical protein
MRKIIVAAAAAALADPLLALAPVAHADMYSDTGIGPGSFQSV